MKKNVMMRLASFLLVAVLISTSAISGTYAKYVTEGTGTDSARVAKWGVTVTANGGMFGEHYNGTTDDKLSTTYTGSVDSQGAIPGNGESKVVAPGTKGDMVSVELSGKPEVAVQVSYKADVELTGWEIDGSEYCPLIITVNGTAYSCTGSVTVDQLEAAVETAIAADVSDVYPAGTDLSTIGADALQISWEWPFETGNTDEEIAANNVKDTALGNATADGNPATIEISVTTTVTQVD